MRWTPRLTTLVLTNLKWFQDRSYFKRLSVPLVFPKLRSLRRWRSCLPDPCVTSAGQITVVINFVFVSLLKDTRGRAIPRAGCVAIYSRCRLLFSLAVNRLPVCAGRYRWWWYSFGGWWSALFGYLRLGSLRRLIVEVDG